MPTPLSSPAANATPKAATPRLRLDYLDGLRGLAALYVVFHHSYMDVPHDAAQGVHPLLASLTAWLFYGQTAVNIFIVLSGYCLMLPVARTLDGSLRGGVKQFFVRRARRILPPYYAALVLFLLIIAVLRHVHHAPVGRWPGSGPVFTPKILISHLFLVHNFSRYWAYTIDYPMWSVATEWQIYFLFPALLLPLWRRYGLGAMTAIAFALGIGLALAMPRFTQAFPWMLGLFALGMAGAVLNFSPKPVYAQMRTRWPWGWLAAVCSVLYCATVHYERILNWKYNYAWDALVGLATVSLMIYCTRHLTDFPDRPVPAVLRLLQSRVAVELGVFSYSLYLVHAPVVSLVHSLFIHLSLSHQLEVLIVSAPIVSVIVAYLFHRIFERPFMPGHPRTEKQAAQAAIVSPAP